LFLFHCSSKADTYPVTAHTTCSDALWAGLPLLTCVGETFISRVSGSVLRAAGLPELVTTSLDEYEATALRLAQNPAELAALRARLAANRDTCPLFDTPRYVRHLERAYELMWEAGPGEAWPHDAPPLVVEPLP
jgi:predicted O-linked N-acetylglucosamine transferase (SPINDLY family)